MKGTKGERAHWRKKRRRESCEKGMKKEREKDMEKGMKKRRVKGNKLAAAKKEC